MKRTSLKNKFRRKAGRYEIKFVTKLWDDATESEKKKIASNVDITNEEEIFLCFIPDDTYWWLITTRRLIIFENELLNPIPLNNITADLTGLTQEIIQNRNFKREKEKVYPLLVADNKKVNLKIEDAAWYVVTEIFDYIFSSNYDKNFILELMEKQLKK